MRDDCCAGDMNKTPSGAKKSGNNLVPPQIVRILILIVTVVALYMLARHFLVPASFGQYGWYRGNALQELRALPTSYAGRAACLECHADVAKKMDESSHKSIACESCHGPNQPHADDPTTTPLKIEDPRFCLRCHQANPSRPARFPQIDSAEHNAGKPCMECHLPHAPTDAPAK